MWAGSEIEIAGSMNFLSFMGRYCTGPERPGYFMLFDEIGDAMAGNAGDNTGVSQDIHAYILKWMETWENSGIMEVGIPGVGKTYGPKALSNMYNIPLIIADVGGMKESGVGDSEANVRAATKLAMAVAGDKVLAIGTTNSTANLSPQLMSRFGFTFFFDLPSPEARQTAWKIYIKKYKLDADQPLPDDSNWTPREIRNCCRTAYALSYPLAEAARFVVPVFKAGATAIANLRQEAHEKYLSDSNPGFYQNPQATVEVVDYQQVETATLDRRRELRPSNYVVQGTTKSVCPACASPVDLLCPKSGNTFKPWFYICWLCKSITQVGVGPVIREEGNAPHQK